MTEKLKFFDKTILQTPNPIHSSSMMAEGNKKLSLDLLDDIPQRLSDIDNSLGVLSIKSSDDIFCARLSDAALKRQSERDKALNSLKQYDSKHLQLTSLPSRYLKKSEVTESSCGGYINSESTISESDLVPGNTSTPRESLLKEEYVMKERVSFGQSVCNIGASMKMSGMSFNDAVNQFTKTMNLVGDTSFQSASAVIAQLEEDEASCLGRNLSAVLKEFSVSSQGEVKMSMGSFFIQKSDDLPKLFAKSPRKSRAPIPLIETSIANVNLTTQVETESLGLTDIQNILSSSESPTKALDELLKVKKGPKSCSPDRKSPETFNEATKENISPDLRHETSVMSSRSSSALSSLPNGKLPIATTKTEIIWGCVKPGKNNSQEFIIRNRSSGRVVIQCSVSNPAFRLHRERSDSNFSNMVKVGLQAYESRTLAVTFCPTTLGAAVDVINFTSNDPNHKQTAKQFIRLFGYGGHGNVTISKVIKDTSGKFLLSLGNIDEQSHLRQEFVVKNHGTLVTFTSFTLGVNGLYPFLKFEIEPSTIILLPGEEREVLVSCSLPKKEFNFIKSKINSPVLEIGKLQVVHGTEVDRARLRKIYQKAEEKNQDVSSKILDLIKQFPGEVMPNDLKQFREPLTAMDEIFRLFNNQEITVTLEQDVDTTLTGQLQDETAMFHSLCENTAVGVFDNTICNDSCHIDPTRIILTPPDKNKDRIFLTNNKKKAQYFEINSTPDGLLIHPKNGTISPDQTSIIEVSHTKKCNNKTEFKVKILVDNDCFDVDVKVVFVGKNYC